MALTLSQAAQDDLRTLVRDVRPESLLLAGSACNFADLIREVLNGGRVEQMDTGSLCDSINELPVFDVILLADVLEALDKHDADVLIGRLRDLHSRHLYAFVRIGKAWDNLKSHWQRTDLLAHGFTLYQRYMADGREYDLCRFDLESYKQTPEWLNSRYWANPELWGKYRW